MPETSPSPFAPPSPIPARHPGIALAALRMALVAGCVGVVAGWLLVGKGSPFARNLDPEFGRNSPAVMAWVVASLPASLLHRAVARDATSEWPYWGCIFVQWSVAGAPLGGVMWGIRRKVRGVRDAGRGRM